MKHDLPRRPLRVLIGCETSGIARRAFAALGHDVWSCDLEPAEDGSNRHVRCDIRDGILTEGWDLLAVMHPPCTRLCRSGRSGPISAFRAGAGAMRTSQRSRSWTKFTGSSGADHRRVLRGLALIESNDRSPG